MMDLAMIETGSGGDAIFTGVDIEVCYGIENLPYLSMFGGAGWYGNELLEPAQQFKSQTEAALLKYALNSAGRSEIEKAINADLSIISENIPGAKIVLFVQIVSDDKLSIEIKIDNLQFSYLWNPSTRFLTYKV